MPTDTADLSNAVCSAIGSNDGRPFLAWVRDCCTLSPTGRSRAKALHESYRAYLYSKLGGEFAYMGTKRFGAALFTVGCDRVRSMKGSVYVGISLDDGESLTPIADPFEIEEQFSEWVEECCQLGPDLHSQARDIMAAFVDWLPDDAIPPTTKQLAAALNSLDGVHRVRVAAGSRWRGISLK